MHREAFSSAARHQIYPKVAGRKFGGAVQLRRSGCVTAPPVFRHHPSRMPLTSVIIPAYDADLWIEESIGSVLAQTW